MQTQDVIFRDLGLISYAPAWEMQEALLAENVAVKKVARAQNGNPNPHDIATQHHLLFCEHNPVYTIGKSGSIDHLLYSEKEMEEKGIEFSKTNRGGDITFHGPGQIVGYPIWDLEKIYTDIGKYLRGIEESVILTLNEYGIKGGRSAGETGVWLSATDTKPDRKICAIGVRCSRWVTMHGFAFNINTPLHYFDGIVPCGIKDKAVTSLEHELGQAMDMEKIKAQLKDNIALVFNLKYR